MDSEKVELYPLRFNPILKSKIWGGDRLNKLYDRNPELHQLGESWELSGIKEDESTVSNGPLAGIHLSELIKSFKSDLVGKTIFEKYGEEFPLLFKLIDADDDLSIQVHPGDETAMYRHQSFGKTEMWYVVDSEPGAELIIGFTNNTSKDAYLEALKKGKVEDLLQKVTVQKGDVFFIPAGLVHAIGKGIVIAEIQQSSDITYRIYDYNRKDNFGKERDLHTDEALDVIDFSACESPKVIYAHNQINQELVKCDYFTTNKLKLNQATPRDFSGIDSFVVYMCLTGLLSIVYENGICAVNKGDTVLIPATMKNVVLLPSVDSELLEVYIK